MRGKYRSGRKTRAALLNRTKFARRGDKSGDNKRASPKSKQKVQSAEGGGRTTAPSQTPLQKLATGTLRRYLWLRWGPRREVITEARVSRGKYQCAKCETLVGPKDYDVDHIEPVVDPSEGFVNLDVWLTRLLVGKKGLMLLCKPCHL